MISQIEIKNIWAEDLFKWFYEHVKDSGGDGAAVIVCDNHTEVADWFVKWWQNEYYHFYESCKKNNKEFWHPKDMRDNGSAINFHDANENFIFSNKICNLDHGDYNFLVKEDCIFGEDYPHNHVRKIKAYKSD